MFKKFTILSITMMLAITGISFLVSPQNVYAQCGATDAEVTASTASGAVGCYTEQSRANGNAVWSMGAWVIECSTIFGGGIAIGLFDDANTFIGQDFSKNSCLESFSGTISEFFGSGTATLNWAAAAVPTPTPTPANQPPIGNDDNFNATEDTALVVGAPGGLANDVDPDGDPIFASNTTAPGNGVLSNFFADGSFIYTPNTNFCGQDAWTYQPTDNIAGQGNVTNVTVDVACTNLPPIGNDDSYQTDQDTIFVLAAPGALVNDTDPDPEDFLNAATTTQPTHGVITNFFADGSLIYTPNPGYCGPDAWTYRAIDGLEGTFGRLYSNVTTVDMFVVCTDPDSAIAYAQTVIDDFLANGDLSQKNYDKLDKKLDKITEKLDAGDTVAACNQADAAISQTGDMLTAGEISLAVHDDIVAAIQGIKDTIPC